MSPCTHENMSETQIPCLVENKLNELNKKIVEIKKKIQLSEGQRKANFEEYDAKKSENARKIGELKKCIKELYARYAKAKNNEEVPDLARFQTRHQAKRAALLSRDSASRGRKRNLEEVITAASEDNVRLRRKLDLIKYQREQHESTLIVLRTEGRELNHRRGHNAFKRKTENPVRKKIESLEVQLEHIRMMQIKANITRMKCRSACSELKEKSVFHASTLKELEDGIWQQESEIKRLQGVKEEAVELRDSTQETLVKEEIEETNSSKRRDSVIKEYRRRVSERKLELERLERMIFHGRPRDDSETRGGKSRVQVQEDMIKDELARLEEAFAKLRNATGVPRSEEVLDRFLGQQATKDSLQKMRAATESEKMVLEKKRQDLSAEIELKKFSETKSAEQNAEMMAKLNSQINAQQLRKEEAEAASRRVHELLSDITGTLCKLCDKFQNVTDTPREDDKMLDPLEIIDLLSEKAKCDFDTLNASDKYLETMDETLLDKLETMSVATTSAEGKTSRMANDGQLFLFPSCATPAVILSEDEEEVPSRNVLKRQAQLLVDTKSRRKGIAFKR